MNNVEKIMKTSNRVINLKKVTEIWSEEGEIMKWLKNLERIASNRIPGVFR